jgi:peptide/nickel transport system substrate-binding protein
MASIIDQELGGLSWTKSEIRRGRMSRRQFVQFAMAAGLSAAAAENLFAKAQAATPKKGGRLRAGISWGSSTNSLDPGTYLDNYMFTVGLTIGSLLAQVEADGSLGTDLAESFDASNKAKSWAVKLRKGATFHNGKDVTPADVIASVRHHMGADSKSAVKSVVSQIDEMKADGNAVIFMLKGGNADFPYVLAEQRLPIMPAKSDGTADWESGIRSGPYVLEEFKPGQVMRGKRYPNYFRDAWFDEVEILSLIDPTARTNALVAGELDFMDRCEAKSLKYLEKQSGVEIDKVTGYEHNVFSMNVTAPPFDNADVRNAIKYAVDREEILRKIYGGIGAVGNDNPVARNVKFAIEPQPVHKFDPDMARSLLKKANVSDLKISLSAADAAFTGAVDAAAIFKDSAAKAGIDLTVVREPNDAYWDNVWLKKPFVASQWLGRPTADGVLTLAYTEDSTQNETFWKNPRFNELLVAARSELDTAKRAQMYAECQQLVHDDGGLINLVFTTYVTAHRKGVAHGPLLVNYDMDGFRIAQRWWAA